MDNFARCLAFTLRSEGGFTDNRADPGNWTGGQVGAGELRGTNFGISAAAYPQLDIANLTAAMAGGDLPQGLLGAVAGRCAAPARGACGL